MIQRHFTRLSLIFWVWIVVVVLASCGEDAAFECFKTAGAEATREVDLDSFDQLVLHDGVNLVISQGPVQKVVVKGGRNLLSKVVVAVTDGTLEIFDENRCNWVRELDQLEVRVTVPDLSAIRQQGYGRISSVGKLQLDALLVEVRDGPGDIVLDLAATELVEVATNGLSNITLRGSTPTLRIFTYSSQGKVLARGLAADVVEVYHDGLNTLEVFPVAALLGDLLSSGNVVYFCEPGQVQVRETGTGRLLKGF